MFTLIDDELMTWLLLQDSCVDTFVFADSNAMFDDVAEAEENTMVFVFKQVPD